MNRFEIVVGTYEQYLLGFQCSGQHQDLKKSFASHCHSASVRAVATSGRYVASGGADDKVFIFDMLKRQELSLLNHQRGTVNSMAFTPDTTHLLVGDASGALIAYATSTWEIHKVWAKAHKGNAVTLIRVHPSGKLAVTLGSELNMQLWNLIRGTCVNTTNLKAIPELGKMVDCIEWNPSGDYLAISGAKVIQIWNTKTAVCERSFPVPSQPTCLAWISEEVFAVGMASGEILFRKNVDGDDVEENQTKEQKMFEKRLKAISLQMPYMAAICSDGEVALFELDFDESFGKFKKLTKTNVGCRPTCVSLLDKSTFCEFKSEEEAEERQGQVSEDDEDDEDDDKVEVPVPQRKASNGKLSRGTVEIIEDDEEDSGAEDDEEEEVAVPPPSAKKNKNNTKSKPGQFVLATPVKKETKRLQKQPQTPASLKKKGKGKKGNKLNKTIG